MEVLSRVARAHYSTAPRPWGPTAAVERHDRRPQETLLFRLVKEHLPEFLARTRESYEKPLPRYVIREFEEVARRTGERVLRRLRKMGLLRDAPDHEGSNETPELTALDGCAQAALGDGGLEAPGEPTDPPAADGEDARFRCRAPQRWAAGWEHFDVHAGVRVGAADDEGRERLCRYVLRPALSLDRLSVLPDGRVAYRVRHPLGPNATHRVMEPVELLARLAAIVPPPRYPLLRYHGVLASGSKWRFAVVPRPPENVPRPTADGAGRPADDRSQAAPTDKTGAGSRPRVPPVEVLLCGGGPAADALLPPRATAAGRFSAWDSLAHEPVIVSPNRLSAAHWARLLDGMLLARSPRLDWPTLRRRTHNVDVLDCPGCHGRWVSV